MKRLHSNEYENSSTILNPKWPYTHSSCTDIRRLFKRESERIASEQREEPWFLNMEGLTDEASN
jgi:hypothetical protein